MRSRPPEISDAQVTKLLERAWSFKATEISYHPQGFGSHHWIATAAGGGKRFVTVDQLDRPFVAGTRGADVLRRAFETAHALRHLAGCEFVVAPERSRRGQILELLGERHSLSVFPFVEGVTGAFGGGHDSPAGRAATIDLLAALHSATSRVPAALPARDDLVVPGDGALRLALAELDDAWSGGPYAEPARSALRTRAAAVRRLLASHDALAAHTRGSERGWVITHGEPHPGNVISSDGGLRLIDWDTVQVALPERDLSMVDGGSGRELERYERATGRSIDPAALQMYRIRWDLAEIAIYVAQFRSPHVLSEDVETSWRSLNHYLKVDEHWPETAG